MRPHDEISDTLTATEVEWVAVLGCGGFQLRCMPRL